MPAIPSTLALLLAAAAVLAVLAAPAAAEATCQDLPTGFACVEVLGSPESASAGVAVTLHVDTGDGDPMTLRPCVSFAVSCSPEDEG